MCCGEQGCFPPSQTLRRPVRPALSAPRLFTILHMSLHCLLETVFRWRFSSTERWPFAPCAACTVVAVVKLLCPRYDFCRFSALSFCRIPIKPHGTITERLQTYFPLKSLFDPAMKLSLLAPPPPPRQQAIRLKILKTNPTLESRNMF